MSKRPPLIRTQAAPDWSTALILLYGPAGVGKTTAALAAPSPLVLDCEGGTKRHAGDVASVTTLADLEGLVNYLASEPHPYESVVLDGLTNFYAMVHTGMNAGKTTRDRRLTHVEPTERLAAALRRLNTLPVLKVVTAHSKDEQDDQGATAIHLALPPAFCKVVEGLVDVAAYCYRSSGAAGKRGMVAEVYTAGRVTSWGKDRTGLLGPKVYPLGWPTLAGALSL